MKNTQILLNRSKLAAGVAPIALGAALIFTPTAAMAQDPASAGELADPQAAGPIIVTGSRIPQPNLESASPITVLNSQEVQQTGTTRVEDLVNSLPQVFAGQGSNVSNGSTGTATLNLRGLGAERNLVLVNGRRLVPGDPGSSAADINVIPGAIISRIDVLTGGASSVYGADAVTGVVNFVLDTNFEGLRVDSQYSLFTHDNNANDDVIGALNGTGNSFPSDLVADGATIDATVIFGAGFDDGRGHVTAYAGYRDTNSVTQSRRDYSACSLSARTQAQVAGGLGEYTCSGSFTSREGNAIIFDSDVFGGATFTSTFFNVGANRTLTNGATTYNFNPTNYYQRPDERYTAGFFADYEISPAIHPYAEFMFMDDRTVAQIAPSGDFGNTTFVNCDNPLLSAQQLAIVCDTENLLVAANAANLLTGQRVVGEFDGVTFTDPNAAVFFDPVSGNQYNRGFFQLLRRNVEGGGRRDDLQHTSYRGVIGSNGELDQAWSYDAYYQYGRTIFSETYFNDFSVSRLTRALDVITDPNTGRPACRTAVTGEDPNCIPYDIFSRNSVNPAALNYLQTPGFQRGLVTEQIASGSFTGELGAYGIQTPWADEGVGVAVGVEYRKENLEFNSDIAFQTGDLAGQGAPTLPVNGNFDVREVFGELRVPIVHDSFIYDLTVTGGYRYSDYQTSAGTGYTTDTYKIEGEFAPIRDVRFRGGYNRAVRAPTVQDLFAPQRVALNGSSDPCAGFVITAADQGCILQGLRVGQSTPLNPAQQYNGLIGGNPLVQPESADTYTVGVVLQPRFLPNFALSADYFNIKVDGAIGGIGQDTILAQCIDTLDPALCGLVNRDAAGSLWLTSNGFVVDTTQNIGGLETSGIDINANYTQEIGSLGSLNLSFVGTWLDELITDTGIGANPTFDCVGLFGNICGTPNPEWRHQARLTWNAPGGIGASVRWRYFDSVTIDALDPNTNLNNVSGGGPAPGGVARPGLDRFPSVNYFDLALTLDLGENYSFRVGANNIFDKDPPLTGSQACPAGPCNGNVFAQVYDTLGRYVYAGVTLDF